MVKLVPQNIVLLKFIAFCGRFLNPKIFTHDLKNVTTALFESISWDGCCPIHFSNKMTSSNSKLYESVRVSCIFFFPKSPNGENVRSNNQTTSFPTEEISLQTKYMLQWAIKC